MTLDQLSMLTDSTIVGYWIWFHERIPDELKCFYSLVDNAIAGNGCRGFEVNRSDYYSCRGFSGDIFITSGDYYSCGVLR